MGSEAAFEHAQKPFSLLRRDDGADDDRSFSITPFDTRLGLRLLYIKNTSRTSASVGVARRASAEGLVQPMTGV